jgi:hypothetical protein
VRRFSTVVRCAAALTLLAIAWIDGAGLEFQARAMACCAHRQGCRSGVSAPDKCCERMGHAARAKTGTIVQSSYVVALAPTPLIAPAPIAGPAPSAHRLGFTRPHDPPHLHAFALLI